MRVKIFFGGVVLTLAVVITMGLLLLFWTASQNYNVLLIGSDQRGTERARSDVLFVVSVPKSGRAQPFFLTIPRDTLVEHPEYGMQKITHFYALGDRPADGKLLGNVDLTRAAVESLLGVKMDATVEVTFTSFAEIIDSLGGAVLRGQTINGDGALQIVRDRFTSGRSDFDRQADAREILRSLITKLKNRQNLKKLQKYFAESEMARWQFDKWQLGRFLLSAGISRRGKITIGEITEEVVPGHSDRIYTPAFGKSLYYWVPDQEALQKIIESHF